MVAPKVVIEHPDRVRPMMEPRVVDDGVQVRLAEVCQGVSDAQGAHLCAQKRSVHQNGLLPNTVDIAAHTTICAPERAAARMAKPSSVRGQAHVVDVDRHVGGNDEADDHVRAPSSACGQTTHEKKSRSFDRGFSRAHFCAEYCTAPRLLWRLLPRGGRARE